VARLRSVNVGLPKDVLWRGRSVYTGIWKAPVDGAAMVRRLNIDGDGQGDLGGHGGEQRAVFVYQLDSYAYWRKFLGRDDFTFGQFGENFTVDGLADDEVRIGDRYRIGAALFEVTQPRVTCYRVGIRMDDPRMPALLVQHRRPGFYFRVLEEGEVRAGDDIVKLADGPEEMTVAEVDGLLYLPGHPRIVHPHPDPVTGHPRLRHLEQCRPDPVPVPDPHLVVGQPVDREVLSELTVHEVASPELALPVAVGIDLVDEHRALLAAVAGGVTLAVAVEVEPSGHHRPVDRALPHPGVHGLAAPGDVLGHPDVD